MSHGAFRSYFDDYTFHHSLNVCLLTTQVVSMAVTNKELLTKISLGALLHDVGKAHVPDDILYKPGRLTDAEFDIVKKHPVLGAEMLIGVEGIDPLCASIAFAHHMHHGIASYPKTDIPYQGDWISRLVSTVDVYEALTAVRPYKRRLSPNKAFQIMLEMPALADKHAFIKMLYNCFGPFPKGTFVLLSTGERAVVVDQDHRFPKRPTIRLLGDGPENIASDQAAVNLADTTVFKTPKSLPRIVKTIVLQEPGDDPLEMDMELKSTEIINKGIFEGDALVAREG